jgi:hypothetical protein
MSTAVAIGSKFGRLTVTGITPRFFPNRETGVNVECSCGTVTVARKGNLVHGGTRSCGCLRKDTSRATLLAHAFTDPLLPSEQPGVRPSTRAILAILAEAGDKGVLVSDITRSFGEPASRSARCRIVNTILYEARGKGRARRAETPEHSPYYRGTQAYRWFITDAGRAALEPSPADRLRARRQEARQRREAALQAVREQGLGPDTPRDIRDKAIRELRLAGVSSEVIGPIFGISGQWVRQLFPPEAIPHCSTCSCTEQIAA